jgi:hypothetical protein
MKAIAGKKIKNTTLHQQCKQFLFQHDFCQYLKKWAILFLIKKNK